MATRKLILLLAVLFMIASLGFAQDASPAAQAKPAINHVPVRTTSPASGKEMYNNYCAVCHGKAGKGGGPAGAALKGPPPDITLLSKNNGGKYPAMKVVSAIKGDTNLPAHGSKEMPMWGELFMGMSGGHEAQVQQRVTNLSRYIEDMQAK